MGAMADLLREQAQTGAQPPIPVAPAPAPMAPEPAGRIPFLSNLADIPRIYREEKAGAVQDLSTEGVLPKMSGILRGLFSPVTAVSGAFVGEPVERATGSETAGTVARIAAELATPGIGFTKIPAALRAATGVRLTGELPRLPKPSIEPIAPIAPEVAGAQKVAPDVPRATPEQILPEGVTLPGLQTGRIGVKAPPEAAGAPPGPPPVQPPLAASAIPEGAPGAVPKATSGIRNAAGNINLDYISEPQNIKEVLEEAAKDIPLERVTNAETVKAANDLGLTEKQLLSRRSQQAFNPQQMIAARDLLINSADRVSELAKGAVGGSDDAVLNFKQAVDRHTAIQAQVQGATSLMGRALQSQRIKVRTPKAIKFTLDSLGGKASIEDIAQAIVDLGDTEKAANFLNQAGRKGFRHGLVEYWVNSILSGPATQVANTIGNTFTSLLQIPEESVAAGLQATRMFGKGGEKLTQRGVAERAYGLISGINDGIRAAGLSLRNEGAATAFAKMETQPAIPGKAGQVVRIPGRLLGATDEFFKTVNYRSELRAQAANIAKAEKAPDVSVRIAELLDRPTDGMLTAATNFADKQTFTNPGGPFVKALQRLKSDVPEVTYVVPFVRTPTNLLKYSIARTPAAALMPSTWAEWASGAAGKARVTSRVLTGTMLQTWMYSLASKGFITGHGPESRSERESLMASGWRPYSMKIGDEYISYRRGDPLSYIVGMMADAQNLVNVKGKKDMSEAALGALTENLTDKAFFKGITDLAMAIEYKNPGHFVQQVASGFIPSALNAIRKEADPLYRETDTVAEAMMNRVPGLSSKLEPKRDVLGVPVPIDDAIGPDILSPLATSKETQDPVRQLLGKGITAGKPAKRIQGKGMPEGGIDLNAKEYSWLVQRQGETANSLLNRVVRNPQFQKAPREQQQAIVNRVFDASRLPFQMKLRMSKMLRPVE